MQHPFDTNNLDANLFNAYEDDFLASMSSVFAQNPQDPTYATPEVPVDQHLTWTPYAATGDPSSMISPAGFHNQVQRSFSAIPMPKLVGNVGGVGLGHPTAMTRGGNMRTRTMELGLLIQPSPSISLPTRTTHPEQRYSPISGSASGSESASSARALSASESKPYSYCNSYSRRTIASPSRQATTGTPSASDEDHDASSLANMTEKEREAQKRRQNAQAASRARRRRSAQAARMQEDVARLQREVNVWRERTRMLEGIAAQAGLVIPRSPDDI